MRYYTGEVSNRFDQYGVLAANSISRRCRPRPSEADRVETESGLTASKQALLDKMSEVQDV